MSANRVKWFVWTLGTPKKHSLTWFWLKRGRKLGKASLATKTGSIWNATKARNSMEFIWKGKHELFRTCVITFCVEIMLTDRGKKIYIMSIRGAHSIRAYKQPWIKSDRPLLGQISTSDRIFCSVSFSASTRWSSLQMISVRFSTSRKHQRHTLAKNPQ